jgi:DNA-binding NtrC family response regulator
MQQPVDLIALDLRRPFDVSGSDLLQPVESLGRPTPVIVLSGWTQDLDRDSLPISVRAVIDRPVRLEEFSATVERALQNDLTQDAAFDPDSCAST